MPIQVNRPEPLSADKRWKIVRTALRRNGVLDEFGRMPITVRFVDTRGHELGRAVRQ